MHQGEPCRIEWQWEVAEMELIWGAVGIALAAVGLVELARVGLFWLLRPRRPGSAALVLLPRDGEDCELLIRAGVARLQWMGWPGCRLVCLNPGEDPNVEAICNIFQRRYPNLELCKCPELVYDKENEKS